MNGCGNGCGLVAGLGSLILPRKCGDNTSLPICLLGSKLHPVVTVVLFQSDNPHAPWSAALTSTIPPTPPTPPHPHPRRSRSQSHSRGSRSPSRDSRSPSRSPTRSRSPSPRRASAQNGVAAAPPGSGGGGSAPPAREGTPDGGAAAVPAAAPQAQARPAGGKPPPSAEAVKKELLRLRRQEKELGGRMRSLQGGRRGRGAARGASCLLGCLRVVAWSHYCTPLHPACPLNQQHAPIWVPQMCRGG